ncbi:XdhC family protein, partial [Myxococcota bacterium]|nr:XdhC family protein [Myxococcota bacterium]
RTHERRLEKLREQNFAEADLARIHTPIGLDLGARSPEEIALAILAEVVAARHQASGASLKTRPGPIHDHERSAQ